MYDGGAALPIAKRAEGDYWPDNQWSLALSIKREQNA